MCSGVLKMIPSNLTNWSIFSLLDPKFISTIHMVIVYGDSVNKALIVTQAKMVYALEKNSIHPIKVEPLSNMNIKTFACLNNETVAVLTEMGKVHLWDAHSMQLLNIGETYSWSKIACGHNYVLGLTHDGQVYCYNKTYNSYNYGPSTMGPVSSTLYKINVTHISCGNLYNVCVTHCGTVYSWGTNNVGQLGINNHNDQNSPVQVTELKNVVIEKVVCGYAHNIALSDEGILYVWGANDYNQLGFSTKTCVSMPTKLKAPLMGRAIDIAASRYSHISVAMTNGRQIFIWGKCLNQIIKVPTLTRLRCLHDAFACFASPRIMHEPLLIQNTTDSNLVDNFKMFFDDPGTSDLIFKVHGKPIHVHKTILKIRSSYYRTMFEGKWMENSQSVIQHELFSYETYRAFLKYLYTDEIDVFLDNPLDLLRLADIYNEDRIKRLCVRLIKETITVDRAPFFYETSIKYDVKDLEEYCFDFALRHMTKVVQTPAFANLNEAVMKNFVIKAAKAGAFKT